MERVYDLIAQLTRQQQQGAAPESLLPTVQALYDELLAITRKPTATGSKKVAVVLPPQNSVPKKVIAEIAVAKPAVGAEPVVAEQSLSAPKNDLLPQSPYAPKPLPVAQELAEPEAYIDLQAIATPQPKREIYSLQKPHITELPKGEKPVEKESPEHFHPHFNAVEETPTLLQQEPPAPVQKELHELISDVKESLNDKLKQERTELAHVLKDTPIKDLRKAIGVNDKFLFVAELFRGDEAMYERSIKTINGFHILPEAEYWINRELKVKLGWNDNRDAVQHFYHLVRRRFS